MKRKIDLQTKVLWITYLILAFTFKDNLICNLLPTFDFFMAKAFMHLFFGMINQEEMREIKNKCSSKDNWIDFSFLLSGVIIFLEFLFILICSYRREFILESSNYYLILYLPNIGFSILNLLMAINIHKIKSIRTNSNEVDTKIDENILLLKKHLEQFDKPLINIANGGGRVKISKMKYALIKANNAEQHYNTVMNQLLIECQHYCNFEILFCEYQSGDGFCLGYEANGYDNNLISVRTFIELVSKHKRKLELEDVIKTF